MNTLPDFDSMVINILAAYADATPSERRDGFAWYPEALDFARALSDAYPISVEQSAAVIAALSPQKDWDGNKRWAAEVCEAWHNGTTLPRRGLTNSLTRATVALRGDLSDILRTTGTLKVNRFYRSILGERGVACVDRHAIRVAMGDFVSAPPSLSDGTYLAVESAYLEAARELRKGARHIQAVTWLVARRERGLADDPNKYARVFARK